MFKASVKKNRISTKNKSKLKLSKIKVRTGWVQAPKHEHQNVKNYSAKLLTSGPCSGGCSFGTGVKIHFDATVSALGLMP